MTMEVTIMVSDPPQFGEIREGWYEIDNEWWLTRDAVLKEFKLSNKQLSAMVLATRNRTSGDPRLRTTIGRNPYNDRAFVLYSLDDLTVLWQEMKRKGLLPKAEEVAT